MAVNNEQVIVLDGGGGMGSGLGGQQDPLYDPNIEMPPTIGEQEEDEVSETEVGEGFDHQGPPGGRQAGLQDEMGVRHCFYDFCKQTILHGWHYLADLEQDQDRNNGPAQASPSFHTFTPVSSPNNTLAVGNQNTHINPRQPLMLHANQDRGRSRSPSRWERRSSSVHSSQSRSPSRSRSRSNSHHHVTLNARASGSGHANVSITHHHHCCSCRGNHVTSGTKNSGPCPNSTGNSLAVGSLAVGHSHQMVATSAVASAASTTQIVPDKEVVGSYSEDMSSKGRGSDQDRPGGPHTSASNSRRFLCCGSCSDSTSEDSRMSAYEPNQNSPSSTTVSIRNRKSTQPSGDHLNSKQLPHQKSTESKATDTSGGCKNNKKSDKPNHVYSIFRSSFWTLIIMASVVSGGFFLHNNTSEFLHSTVQTTLDNTVPLSEVFFPSVVVCNINQIRKSFFEELGFYENDTLVRIMYEDFIKGTMDADWEASKVTKDPKRNAFYEVLKTYLEKKNLTVEGSITWLSHQECSDMYMYSKWNGTTTYGFGANERDFGTDYGICCWYTPQLNFSAIPDGPDTDWAYWFNSVPKGAKTGKDNGFSVLFDIESYDYGYYDEGSEGLKVAIVHHLDMPIIRQRAFHVAPGTENQIPVTPTLYTTNQQALERFSPEERDCYQENEIDLLYLPKSHGYRYEMSNCLFEAAYEQILEQCRCAPGFHNEGGDAAYAMYPVCKGKQLSCSNSILNRMGEFDHVLDVPVGGEGSKHQHINKNKTKKCLTNCEDQINDLFVTTSNYPNKKTFKEREEFCLLVKKLIRTCKSDKRRPLSTDYPNLCPTLEMVPNAADYCNSQNRWRTEKMNNKTLAKAIESEIHSYAKENLAIINIFIKEPSLKRFRKTEKMSRISYIASSGGLLGLCMGFSFVSLAEIVYHCFLCIVLLFRKKRALFKKKQAQKTR